MEGMNYCCIAGLVGHLGQVPSKGYALTPGRAAHSAAAVLAGDGPTPRPPASSHPVEVGASPALLDAEDCSAGGAAAVSSSSRISPSSASDILALNPRYRACLLVGRATAGNEGSTLAEAQKMHSPEEGRMADCCQLCLSRFWRSQKRDFVFPPACVALYVTRRRAGGDRLPKVF